MTTETTLPYHWIQHIPSSLLELDGIPLLGSLPLFPWEKLQATLGSLFAIEALQIKPLEIQWRSVEEILSGFGNSAIPLYISIPGIDGTLCWVLAETDIAFLMSRLLTTDTQPLEGIDSDFEAGFYHFLAVETLHAIAMLHFDKALSPQINRQINHLPQEAALCLDIAIHIPEEEEMPEKELCGRVVISPEFRLGWKKRYANRNLQVPISPVATNATVTIHLEAGRTALKLSEWSRIVPGDFLLLDFCSLKSGSDAGRIMLTVNEAPLFRAKIKEGNIKILEHPLYHEVDTAMSKKLPDHNESEDEDEDDYSFLKGEEDEELEELYEEDDKPEKEYESEEENEQEQEHDSNEDDEKKTKEPSAKESANKPFSAEDITLNIVVEVGRLQMTIQKLLELQPGNLLELNVHPENGVDLVISGKRIAKGELLLIGESLGIRILDIG